MSKTYYFSDDELVVLSSLFGGMVIYGVNSKLFSYYHQSDHPQVKQIIDRLEEKGTFYFDYNGKIHFSSEVYDLIETISHPEQLLCIKTTPYSGQNETYYFYKKNDNIYQMKKGRQLLALSKCREPFEIEGVALNISEHLTKKDVLEVEEMMEWFDEVGAFEYLKQHTHQPELVKKIMNNEYDQYHMEYYIWEDKNISYKNLIEVGSMNQELFEWIESGDEIIIQGGIYHYQQIIQKMFGEVKE